MHAGVYPRFSLVIIIIIFNIIYFFFFVVVVLGYEFWVKTKYFFVITKCGHFIKVVKIEILIVMPKIIDHTIKYDLDSKNETIINKSDYRF